MSRSLRVRVEYIDKVKLALKRKGFPRQIDLAEQINISKNTVNKFFTGKVIDHLNFIEICTKLCLNWQEIADLSDFTETTAQETETQTAQQTVSVTVEVNSNVEANLTDDDVTERNEATAKRVILQQAIPSVPVWKGRDELLEKLKAKLTGLETDSLTSSPKVLAIIGQGGIGKTSLAVKLLEAVGVNLRSPLAPLNKGRTCAFDCVMYFKVQEGTSFDDVAEFLLAGLGIERAETLKSAEEKIGRIIAGLAESRCLLLLDNLETILHPANDSCSAGILPANEEVEAGKMPTLQANEEAGRMPTLRAHRAIVPDWGKLLNALVYQQHNSQTILTSREVPADLADSRYDGAEPDSELVHIEIVSGVDLGAGVEILQQRQLRDNLSDLEWVSLRVEGHVFLLTQLAAIGKGKPGFLRKHPELVTKKAEPILTEQLARQSAAARDLLKRMCVLRVPIDVPGLTFLRLYTDDIDKDHRFELAAILEEPAELTEAEIRETEGILERLVDSSLVQCRYDEEKCELFYDLHRVIVEFLQADCQEELPKLLESVYKFYCTGKNVENPQTLEDLRPVLEAQYFAFQLGNYSEAYYLIKSEYLYRWGNWSLLQELCEQILPYLDDDDRSYCLGEIGCVHRNSGRWDEAEKCFLDALSLSQKQEIQDEIPTFLGYLGDIERFRGNLHEAERLYRQSLDLRTQLGDRAGMAATWQFLGYIEQNRGNWDEAEHLFRQSLNLRTQLGDRAGVAETWRHLGYIEQFRGNLDEAERLYRQSLEVKTQLGDRAGMAAVWGVLGYIEQNRGNWEEAERLYRQSLELRTQLGDRAGMAAVWASLGDIEQNRGNWEEAERLYQQSLELRTQLGDRAGMATSWGLLGYIEQNRGNWDEAERLYRQCLEIETQLGDRAGMAVTWGVLGDIERKRGNWEEAERLYQQSLELRTQLGDRAGMAAVWGVLGYIEQNRGNWEEAERLYRQSLELRTQLGDRAGMAASWGLLGDIEQNRGNWEEAERLYRQSLELRTQLGDRAGMATSWGVLGDIEQNRGNWDEAERLYRQCLEIETQLGDRAGMAVTWGLLGDIEQNRGNWDEAERLYQQCLSLSTELGYQTMIIGCIGGLGTVELKRGNLDAAEPLLKEALEKMQELGMTSSIAETNYDLAQLYRQRNNTELAQQHYNTAHQIFQQLSAAKDLERIEKEWEHN
ncbi:tetratricopeptide repeat protein [Aerosakkonemataceae cyanobacterium BLCC-F154]|uniref:Tetratricopeptide repeat protein n=1 Tax=Floridaenema fluviatile BLCC-F154 TaxID=3153640 RepID=A0ABV4Y5U2_9CYAN